MTHTQVANGPRSVKNIPSYAHGYVYSDNTTGRYIPADSLKWAEQSTWLALQVRVWLSLHREIF